MQHLVHRYSVTDILIRKQLWAELKNSAQRIIPQSEIVRLSHDE